MGRVLRKTLHKPAYHSNEEDIDAPLQELLPLPQRQPARPHTHGDGDDHGRDVDRGRRGEHLPVMRREHHPPQDQPDQPMRCPPRGLNSQGQRQRELLPSVCLHVFRILQHLTRDLQGEARRRQPPEPPHARSTNGAGAAQAGAGEEGSTNQGRDSEPPAERVLHEQQALQPGGIAQHQEQVGRSPRYKATAHPGSASGERQRSCT
eukprot:scaffold34747_cov60-Phaeocystis_antarctica.AAC.1